MFFHEPNQLSRLAKYVGLLNCYIENNDSDTDPNESLLDRVCIRILKNFN